MLPSVSTATPYSELYKLVFQVSLSSSSRNIMEIIVVNK
jgi:hypothetical protein